MEAEHREAVSGSANSGSVATRCSPGGRDEEKEGGERRPRAGAMGPGGVRVVGLRAEGGSTGGGSGRRALRGRGLSVGMGGRCGARSPQSSSPRSPLVDSEDAVGARSVRRGVGRTHQGPPELTVRGGRQAVSTVVGSVPAQPVPLCRQGGDSNTWSVQCLRVPGVGSGEQAALRCFPGSPGATRRAWVEPCWGGDTDVAGTHPTSLGPGAFLNECGGRRVRLCPFGVSLSCVPH